MEKNTKTTFTLFLIVSESVPPPFVFNYSDQRG